MPGPQIYINHVISRILWYAWSCVFFNRGKFWSRIENICL